MAVTRKTVIAAIAAVALGGSMVGSTAPAQAHTYKKEGTVSAKEANKLFKEAFKQKCLTLHEARHIVHGHGGENSDYDDEGNVAMTTLYFDGTKKSHIDTVYVEFAGGCATGVYAYKR
jgi:hypothetical protein